MSFLVYIFWKKTYLDLHTFWLGWFSIELHKLLIFWRLIPCQYFTTKCIHSVGSFSLWFCFVQNFFEDSGLFVAVHCWQIVQLLVCSVFLKDIGGNTVYYCHDIEAFTISFFTCTVQFSQPFIEGVFFLRCILALSWNWFLFLGFA